MQDPVRPFCRTSRYEFKRQRCNLIELDIKGGDCDRSRIVVGNRHWKWFDKGTHCDEELAKGHFVLAGRHRTSGNVEQSVAQVKNMILGEAIPIKKLNHGLEVVQMNSIPVPSDLHLRCMRSKELNIRVWVVEQRHNQTPRLWTLLQLKELLLRPPRCLNVLSRYVCILNYLDEQKLAAEPLSQAIVYPAYKSSLFNVGLWQNWERS